jgi:hypothetical protein
MPKENSMTKILALAALALAPAAFGQQTDVRRFDAFFGYTYLKSPKISLPEHGFHLQVGVRPTTWYSLGFDYSNAKGDMILTPDLLPTALQESLAGQLKQLAALGRLPAGYQIKVKAHSESQTMTVGPQLAYRKFQRVTLFLRPSCGAIRELATPKPEDAIATGIVHNLAPRGVKTDWTYFYGVGYGMDLNITKHFAMRFQGDLVRDHLFNDILRESRGTMRFSVGPAINFGKNIVEK